MEKALSLVYFKFKGEIGDKEGLEKILNNLPGVDSVDILCDDKVIYISFDKEYVSADAFIEVLKENGVELEI